MPGVRPNCDCVCTPFGHHPKADRILLLETDTIAQAGMHITTISCTKRVKRSSKSAFDKQLCMYPNRAYVKNRWYPKAFRHYMWEWEMVSELTAVNKNLMMRMM